MHGARGEAIQVFHHRTTELKDRSRSSNSMIGRQASQPAMHHRLAASLARLSRSGLDSQLMGFSKPTATRCVTHDGFSFLIRTQNGARRLKGCAAHHGSIITDTPTPLQRHSGAERRSATAIPGSVLLRRGNAMQRRAWQRYSCAEVLFGNPIVKQWHCLAPSGNGWAMLCDATAVHRMAKLRHRIASYREAAALFSLPQLRIATAMQGKASLRHSPAMHSYGNALPSFVALCNGKAAPRYAMANHSNR